MRLDPDKVYFYRIPVDRADPPPAAYRDLAHAALSRLEFELPARGTIAFKPNITIAAEPETRIITHPAFVVGLLEVLVERGVTADRLVVAEGHGRRDAEAWARVTGYAEALAPLNIGLTDLNQAEGRKVPVTDGVVYPYYETYHEVADCALFFNVPVAKCHNLSCTTLCTKNLQGTIVTPQRHLCSVQAVDEPVGVEALARLTDSGLSLHEERFCHKHADMVSSRRNLDMPRLCVIDGMVGRDGTGFRHGDNRPMGWTLIGVNETHVDAVGTYLMGLDPEVTPYLRVAAARGLGGNRVADIEVVDLASGRSLDAASLAARRLDPPLMPLARFPGGYYARYRGDGTVVPWMLDRVNEQRLADGLEPIAVEGVAADDGGF